MNIPLKWLSDYIDIPADLKKFTERLSMIGHMLDKIVETDTDTIIDLELRGNRADCYGLLGIARESQAYYGGRFEIPKPKFPLPDSISHYSDFTLSIKSTAVKRFYSCTMSGIKKNKSPEWLKTRLKDYGIDSVNMIVDVTNYVMIESGMPLHAFDKSKIEGDTLIIRNANKGDVCETFDGTILQLIEDDVVFAGIDNNIYGLVGVIGSKDSGINDKTTDIILECAGYDQKTIRMMMMRHGIHTEAGIRHSHHLHEILCDYALSRAASLICELSEGSIKVIEVNDYYPYKSAPKPILFDTNEVKRLSLTTIPVIDQARILERLDMVVEISPDSPEKLIVTPPLYRTDISIAEDLVEEVLRIWGYEKIPTRTLSSSIPEPLENFEYDLEEKTRDVFISFGLNEIVSVPFVEYKKMEKVNDPKIRRAVSLVNPPTSIHTHLRTHMFYEHLTIASLVLKRGAEDVSFFEIGKKYEIKDHRFVQPPHSVNFPYAEYRVVTGTLISSNSTIDFYTVKGMVETYLSELRINDVTFSEELIFPYVKSASIKQRDSYLGILGIVSPLVAKGVFEISHPVFMFEFMITHLVNSQKQQYHYISAFPYPPIKMDLTIDIPANNHIGNVLGWIKNQEKLFVRDLLVMDVYEKEKERSVQVRIIYQCKDRTLQHSEIQKIHLNLAKKIQSMFQISIRGV